MILDFKKKRSRLQKITFFGLPLVLIGGWFYPLIGFILLGCMLGALGVALYKGRAWCDWMCPRGSYYDLFIKKLSRGREIPEFFKKTGVRISIILILFSVLGSQIYLHWGDWSAVGKAFVIVLTVTTLVGTVLGIVYQQRIWCHICPMGSFSNLLSEGKYPLVIKDSCANCKVCAKACPMQLRPYSFKEAGIVGDNDCIKCSTCVTICPKKALSFNDKKAA